MNVQTTDDDELLAAINHEEHIIRSARTRLSVLNAEWARRHANDRCADVCREPMAPFAMATR